MPKPTQIVPDFKTRKTTKKVRLFLARYKLKIKGIWSFLQRENFIRLLLILVLIIIFSSLGLLLVEPDLSLSDSFWWTIVTLTTVGYGDITPTTTAGRMIAIVDMILGVGVLAVISANIASILVDRKIREDLGMSSYKFEDHIIICEWNYRARVILKELRHEKKTKEKPIILISEIERKPVDDPNLFFVKGEVSDETLQRANLEKANTVIILGDDHLDYKNRDAKVILSTLTVESINRSAYTIVELIDEAYIPTCKRAHADEIIVSNKLSSRLISNAAINHGISNVISDLLSYEYGNQLYKIAVPESEVGRSFMELFIYMKEVYQSIIIAIQKGEEGKVISNPASDYILEASDYLIIIAACRKPKFMLLPKSH